MSAPSCVTLHEARATPRCDISGRVPAGGARVNCLLANTEQSIKTNADWHPIYPRRLHIPPIGEDYGKQLEVAAAYIAANRSWLPRLIWMDTPPQHFNTPTGRFNRSLPLKRQKRCRNIQRLPGVREVGVAGVAWSGCRREQAGRSKFCTGVSPSLRSSSLIRDGSAMQD